MTVHYKNLDKNFIVTVLPSTQNSLKSGFQCICNIFKSNIKSHLSAAINACYQKVLEMRTEYSGLAVIGFENEDIIQQLTTDIEFFPIFLRNKKFNMMITNISDLDKNKFYRVSTGFVSSFTIRYHSTQYLFVLRIEENQCSLKIYSESVCINHIIGQTPDEAWNKAELYKKYTGSYLFGIMNLLVRE
ncbi:2556_t:CDS:2, partial [Scutellospora calospora]